MIAPSLSRSGLALVLTFIGGGLTLGCASGDKPPPREPAAAAAPREPSGDPSWTASGTNAARPSSTPDAPAAAHSTLLPPSPTSGDLGRTGEEKPIFQGANGSTERGAKTERPLSDRESIAVVLAANDGEVMMADVALRKAGSADVKSFAGMMKNHHTTGTQKTKALVTRTKLEPVESDASTTLKGDVDQMMKDFHGKEGAAFDRTYMTSQLKAHRDVLAVIDTRILPGVSSSELKAHVMETRRQVSDHLVKAEEIQRKLDPTASRTTGPAGVGLGLGIPEPREPMTGSGSKQDTQRAKSTPRP